MENINTNDPVPNTVRDEIHEVEKLDLKTLSDEAVVTGAIMFCFSLRKFAEKNWEWLVEARARFQYRQGCRGVQLDVEGTPLYWDEFLEKYLGSTTENFRKINQQLHGNGKPPEPEREPEEEADTDQAEPEAEEPEAEEPKIKLLDLERLVGKVITFHGREYKVTDIILGRDTDDVCSFKLVAEHVCEAV